jgi:branched-chain amino acid transport system permease protein
MSSLETFLQQIINGLTIGMGYVLMATGLTLVFGVMNVINFAHGEFYMLGAYFTVLLMEWLPIGYFLAGLIAIAAVGILGLAVHRLAVAPLMGTHHLNTLLSTFAVSLFILYSVYLGFGSFPRRIVTPLGYPVQVGGLFLTGQKIFAFIVGLLIIVGLNRFLRGTTLGKLLRATSQNREAAAIVGINIRKIERVAFVIGLSLAGLAGVLMGPMSLATPQMGQVAMIKAFAILVIGGMGSIPGAIVGGLLLGVIEALGAGYVSSAWKDAIAYGVLVLVLLARPNGLFGVESEVRA